MLRLVALVACALVTPACHDGSRPPTRLLDGTPTRVPSVTLAGVEEPVVQTSARLVPIRGRAGASCARSNDSAPGRQSAVVLRVGVTGRSLTRSASSGRALLACDATSPNSAASWCGHAYSRLPGGRLPDPRLDLTCTDRAGKQIAFAWIVPAHRTRYLVVAQHGYAEAYEVLAGLPVRVTSQEVDVQDSSATFRVTEHDRDGRLLRRYRVETAVAG